MADEKSTTLRLKISGKWVELSESQILKHPGGPVILQYSNAEATQMFDAFHAGSAKAYKQLATVLKSPLSEAESKVLDSNLDKRSDVADINIIKYDITVEQEKKIVQNFEKLRQEVISRGWMEGSPVYYSWKLFELAMLFALTFYLQSLGWYMTSAVVLALVFQQGGWLAHEFCHHQPGTSRELNDAICLVVGGVGLGYSRDWWKNKHNTHHSATNVVDHDTDIDVAPLFSFIPADLQKYKHPLEKMILKIVPYQHLYFTLALPLIRFSWWGQSLGWAFSEQNSAFRVYRRNALSEQIVLVLHWAWILTQLYLMPNNYIRIAYFLLSQSLGGFLTGHVVTYSHNSVDKYPANSRILNNFACLQILTTRNMNPSPFIDWLWGGLNYQVEHHLFPTMPRNHLNECSQLVKKFCADNGLDYLCDDYTTGYSYNLKQLENIAKLLDEQNAHSE